MVECLVQDFQAEQEQETEAQDWVARLQPIHLPLVH